MGYLLNTTFVLHTSVEAGFITWVREVYLPAAAEAGVFGVSRVAKVLTQVEPDTVSIAVQLEATSIEEASRWHDNTAALLRDDLHARWGDRLMFFTTYMEVL
ncbi:MAG: DUF4286 family protein [Muribaculaceae bacterium]